MDPRIQGKIANGKRPHLLSGNYGGVDYGELQLLPVSSE